MKARWKIGLELVALGVMGGVLILRSGHGAQAAAEETRRTLREQGFKTDLSDFDFGLSQEMRERVGALGLNNQINRPGRGLFVNSADLMKTVGERSAVVIWKETKLADPAGFAQYSYLYNEEAGKDVWSLLHDQLADERAGLDTAAEAVLSGPLRYPLKPGAGGPPLLPHLAGVRRLSDLFAAQIILALHENDTNAAWTNLLAATRLVTAWDIEPVEISQMVRCYCLEADYKLTWQSLQRDDWPDERLAQLQRGWESLDLLSSLPDTVAFTGASDVAACRQERLKPAMAGTPMTSPFKSPRQAFDEWLERWREKQYLAHGTYVDEKDMLLFYRDRVTEMRRAVQSQTWAEMRGLAGITNQVFFESRYTNHLSRAQATRRTRQIAMAFQRRGGGRGSGLAERMAEAEARRRLMIAAIALERFHGRHGAYPKTLEELAPEFLKATPADFMDGKLLRYSTTEDGHFFLYSVGLTCMDDGGKMPMQDMRATALARMRGGFASAGGDLVWPEAASAGAAKALAEEKEREAKRRKEEAERMQAEQESREETERQAAVKTLLADPKYKTASWSGAGRGTEPTCEGQPLSKFFYNGVAHGTNRISLDEMLTLKQVMTGDEPEVVTFQLPISYDVVTNLFGGRLSLLADSGTDDESVREPEWQGCERATNGDCLLSLFAAAEAPGWHALQAVLRVETKMDSVGLQVRGPVMAYLSTNLCRFSPEMTLFSDRGASLYARLPESKGTYSIEIKTRSGTHVKTLTGSTTNGLIDVEWNLTDDKGGNFTNKSFQSIFTVKLTESGRSQTMKQEQNKIGTRGED